MLLGGCNNSGPPQPDGSFRNYVDTPPWETGGGMGGPSGSLFNIGKSQNAGAGTGQGAGLGVNAYLWRGALDTLSFMPLASEDPFGGVIQTDWYQPPSALDERFKATAYVLASDLRPDAIRVAIFREVMQGGQWAPAPVSKTTVAEIENKILARARQLRADGVKVTIFRQVQQNGTWVDAPVAVGTSADIENKVLAKARELRAQSASSQ